MAPRRPESPTEASGPTGTLGASMVPLVLIYLKNLNQIYRVLFLEVEAPAIVDLHPGGLLGTKPYPLIGGNFAIDSVNPFFIITIMLIITMCE